MSIKSQQQRLLKQISKRCIHPESHIENNTLFTPEQAISLKPLLNTFSRIQTSREYTHLPSLLGKEEPLPVASMYVELAIAKSHSPADPYRLSPELNLAEEQEKLHKQKLARRISIEQAVDNTCHNKVIILGDPGSGKTSILKYLCLSIADGKSDRWVLPIYISLRRYWFDIKRSPDAPLGLLHYAAISLFDQQNCFESNPLNSLHLKGIFQSDKDQIVAIENILTTLSGSDHSQILFLLDGFDEIATQEKAIETITTEIHRLSDKFSWVLTSRHTGFFGGLGDDVRYEMVSLHNQGIIDLVENWFSSSSQADAQRRKKQLLKQIWENPRLKQMARNPFLLTLLCYLQRRPDQSLPLQRSEIYAKIIQRIREQLQNLNNNDHSLFSIRELNYLSEFCYHLYNDVPNAPLQLFDRDIWDSFNSPQFKNTPDLDKHFLASRLLSCWGEDEDYHLVHLTFQEYLIAEHISKQSFKAIIPHLFRPHWRTVIRFLGGIYWKKDQEKYTRLLHLLLDSVDQLGMLYIEAAWLLLEAGVENSSEILGEDLREKLWMIWLEGQPYLEDAAGEALAVLCPYYTVEKVTTIINNNAQTRLHKRAVKLLGKIFTEESDELLLELYSTTLQEHSIDSATVCSAIANKNTAKLRNAVLQLSDLSSPQGLKNICMLAEQTRHKDFLAVLTEKLQQKPASPQDYTVLFLALKSLSPPELDKKLLEFINAYPLDQIPDALLEILASLQTTQARDWFKNKQSDTDSIESRLLVTATKYNFSQTKDVLDSLFPIDSVLSQKLIQAIGSNAFAGNKTRSNITDAIAKIAFSDHKSSITAFNTLRNIETQNIQSEATLTISKNWYRQYLHHSEPSKVINALAILSQYKDHKSYQHICQLAKEHSITDIRIASINAIVYFKERHKTHILKTLLEITQDNSKPHVVETALNAIGQIDFPTLMQLEQTNAVQKVQTRFCAKQGILLFDDSYINRSGKRYYWDVQLNLPKLTQALNPLETKHQDALITVMQYLLKSKKASISAQYDEYSTKVPLFRDSGKQKVYVNSVDKRTGSKLLKDKKYLSKPEKIEQIIDWVINKFPDIYLCAANGYDKKLDKNIHRTHIIIASAWHIEKSRTSQNIQALESKTV